eukprot:scaffold273389_cov29-Tisochrysis_lutea.AAC.3
MARSYNSAVNKSRTQTGNTLVGGHALPRGGKGPAVSVCRRLRLVARMQRSSLLVLASGNMDSTEHFAQDATNAPAPR